MDETGDGQTFQRSAELISPASWERAQAAKFKLESFYSAYVNETYDRETRYASLFVAFLWHGQLTDKAYRRRQLTEQMARDGVSEDKQARMLASHGKKESDFLRLRRVRLGVSDFQTLKVIGKGAFGEVGICLP
jgi:hypothetical protein